MDFNSTQAVLMTAVFSLSDGGKGGGDFFIQTLPA